MTTQTFHGNFNGGFKNDHKVVGYWKRYDIRLQLESNWATLGPRLRCKLHFIGGG